MHSPGSRPQRIFSGSKRTRACSAPSARARRLQTLAFDGMELGAVQDWLQGILAVSSRSGVEAQVIAESGVIPARASHHLFRYAALSGVDAHMDCSVHMTSGFAPCRSPCAGLMHTMCSSFEECVDELLWTDLSDEETRVEKLFTS